LPKKAAAPAPATHHRAAQPFVAALVANAACAQAAAKAGAERIYAHPLALGIDPQAGDPLTWQRKGQQATPWLPVVAFDSKTAEVEGWLASRAGAVVANPGELYLAHKAGQAELEVAPNVAAFNPATLELLAACGVQTAWLSPELCLEELRELAKGAPVACGVMVYGQQELMVTEHCVLMGQGPCDQRCTACARRKAPRLLEDRKGYKMPVRTDDWGRSHLYNAVTLDLVPYLPDLVTCGISGYLVDCTLMTTLQTENAVARAARGLRLAVNGTGQLPKQEGTTTGHLFRPVD
jgi:putative protease